jgi:four helix bundle protein
LTFFIAGHRFAQKKMKQNIVKEKSEAFSLELITLLKKKKSSTIDSVLTNQLLRSGTAVGAMINEAEFAESRKDFKHKFQIAQKEINESLYWLRLLRSADSISDSEFEKIDSLGKEILFLITAIIRKTMMNMKK